MREELVEAVLRVVEEIPPGRVATYGMIARAVGTGPRVVGRIMHDWGGGVPWWRVVNVHGVGEGGDSSRSDTREGVARAVSCRSGVARRCRTNRPRQCARKPGIVRFIDSQLNFNSVTCELI